MDKRLLGIEHEKITAVEWRLSAPGTLVIPSVCVKVGWCKDWMQNLLGLENISENNWLWVAFAGCRTTAGAWGEMEVREGKKTRRGKVQTKSIYRGTLNSIDSSSCPQKCVCVSKETQRHSFMGLFFIVSWQILAARHWPKVLRLQGIFPDFCRL